jgi:dolichol-phosphate mannosyltransferase
MSGFFAIGREAFSRGSDLAPLGFKIALELLCKCRITRVREVPIRFGTRQHGVSKLTLKEQFRYLEHLSRLYDYRFPRLSPGIKFVVVVLLGLLLAAGADVWLARAGTPGPWRAAGAYVASLVLTAVFHLRYVRTQRAFLVRRRPWRDFAISVLAELTVVSGVAWLVASRFDQPSRFELLLIPFACGIVMRYIVRKELAMDVRGLRAEPLAAERTTPR